MNPRLFNVWGMVYGAIQITDAAEAKPAFAALVNVCLQAEDDCAEPSLYLAWKTAWGALLAAAAYLGPEILERVKRVYECPPEIANSFDGWEPAANNTGSVRRMCEALDELRRPTAHLN